MDDKNTANWKFIVRAPCFLDILNDADFIGGGSFGDVFRYEDDAGSNQADAPSVFAVKRIRLQKPIDKFTTPPSDIEDVSLLLSLSHKNLVKLYRCERGTFQIYLFFEYMQGGNVRDLLQSAESNVLPENTVRFYTAQTLKGLEYLHVRSIVHRDVKPDNLMLDKTHKLVKLTDYSFIKPLNASCTSSFSKLTGTPKYMAPEVVRREKYSVKVDIWSLGVTLVEMLTGSPPFANLGTEYVVMSKIKECTLSSPKPDYDLRQRQNVSNEAAEFLDRIFQAAALRPSSSALLSMEYLSDAFELEDAEADSSLEYSLSQSAKGRLLIIDNRNFEKVKLKRFGSEIDAARIRALFESIGFQTTVLYDLHKANMLAELQKFATSDCNQEYSSVVVTILSHGKDGCILSTSEEPVRLKEILETLSESNAPLLKGKPKVLIIQACRSVDPKVTEVSEEQKLRQVFSAIVKEAARVALERMQVGNSVYNTSTTWSSQIDAKVPSRREFKHAFGVQLQSNEMNLNVTMTDGGYRYEDGSCEDDDDPNHCVYGSSLQDILVAYSTTSGFVSLRSKMNGSFFIQTFCEVISRYWRKMHLLDLLTLATNLVASEVQDKVKGFSQVPQFESTLRKTFYLSTAAERKVEVKQRRPSTSTAT